LVLCAAALVAAEPAPPTLTLDLGGGVKWEGVLIPAGTYVMGSPVGEAKTEQESALEKQHQVAISQPFYIGKFETTQAQYEAVMGDNPSVKKGPDLPVHNLTAEQAQAYCDKLSQKLGRPVQLPTEAQWEYACRAGTTGPYYNNKDISGLGEIAWFGANSGGQPHPGGQKAPNAWGVYDMLGNIREFTRDLYAAEPLSAATDPTGPTSGEPKNHVVRGAAYTANAANALNMRAATRRPTEALAMTGFRVIVPAGRQD
jgi:formylglycine-generating enzyme required for sulfatase activity